MFAKISPTSPRGTMPMPIATASNPPPAPASAHACLPTIAAAVKTRLDHRPEYDSLFGVTALQTRLWWDGAHAVNHDPKVLLRTQDLPPIYEENSNIYLFDRETLERRGNRIGDRPLLFPIDRAEAWDIDEEIDWTVVAALYAQREAGGE